jgi:hypothetical protein
VRLDHIDIPDELANEIEQRTPDLSWTALIVASLRYALEMADNQQHDNQPLDDETEQS